MEYAGRESFSPATRRFWSKNWTPPRVVAPRRSRLGSSSARTLGARCRSRPVTGPARRFCGPPRAAAERSGIISRSGGRSQRPRPRRRPNRKAAQRCCRRRRRRSQSGIALWPVSAEMRRIGSCGNGWGGGCWWIGVGAYPPSTSTTINVLIFMGLRKSSGCGG